MADDAGAAIRAYKSLLLEVLERRPSGTRQRLADALGKHRSFVTQMASPAYTTPIPRQHLPTIFAVCHFSADERRTFAAAYEAAHRTGAAVRSVPPSVRNISLPVPDFGDTTSNAAFDAALAKFAQDMARIVRRGGKQ